MWSALEAVAAAKAVRNGVMIVVTPECRGRIGVFCNRLISGAIVDQTGVKGKEALQRLLSAKSGMFGFRPCFSSEVDDIKQGLNVDITDIVLSRGEFDNDATPADVIRGTARKTEQEKVERLHFSSAGFKALLDSESLSSPLFQELLLQQAPELTPAQESQKADQPHNDVTFSYLNWLQEPSRDAMPTFGQILNPVLPPISAPAAESDTKNTKENGLERYNDLVEQELAKIDEYRRHSVFADDGQKHRLQEDLKLFDEMLNAERNLIKTWNTADLNAIPTPGQKAPRSKYSVACSDLVSSTLTSLPSRKAYLSQKPEVAAQAPRQLPFANSLKVAVPVLIVAVLGGAAFVYHWFTHQRDLLHQAIANLDAGKPAEALSFLEVAVQESPGDANAWYLRGLALARTGSTKEAVNSLNAALARGEDKDRILAARASVELQAHHFQKALQDASEVIVDDSNNVEAYKVRAICYSHDGDFPSVIDDCNRALSLAQDKETQARLLRERGAAYAKLRKWPECVADFSKVIACLPSGAAYMQRAEAYREQKEFATALGDYSKALKYNPTSLTAQIGRGICELNLQQYDDALADFNAVLKKSPSQVEALIQRGSVFLARQEWQSAADDFQLAASLNPFVAEAQDKLSIACHHISSSAHPHGTEAALPIAPQTKLPADVPALLQMGYKYLGDGAIDEAILCFARAVRQSPSNPSARRYLAYAFWQRGDFADAVVQLEALNTLGQLDSDDSLLEARCLENSGQMQKAEKILLTLIKANPDDLAAEAELAKAYMSMGLTEKSKDLCRDGLGKAKTDKDRRLFQAVTLTAPQHAPAAPGGAAPGTIRSAPNNSGQS